LALPAKSADHIDHSWRRWKKQQSSAQCRDQCRGTWNLLQNSQSQVTNTHVQSYYIISNETQCI